jgi:hypothetical protein
MTRSESKQATLCELGAVPVIADALDPDRSRRRSRCACRGSSVGCSPEGSVP